MLTDPVGQVAVCAVCEEVFEIDGELPICENCLARLDRWMPEPAGPPPVIAAK